MDSARSYSRHPSASSSSHYPPTPLSQPAAVTPQHYPQSSQQHQHPPPYHSQQPPYQPAAAHPAYPAYQHPPQPPIEHRPQQTGPPPPTQYASQQPPSATYHPSVPQYAQGGTLPPIQSIREGQDQSGSGAQPSRPVSQQSPHNGRQEQTQVPPRGRPGYVPPPAAVQRAPEAMIRHDTPATPSHQGPYNAPPMSHDPSRTPTQYAEHPPTLPYPHQMTNGHGPPPPGQYEQGPPSYAPTPTMEHQQSQYSIHGQYPPPPPPQQQQQQPVYQPGYGPVSFGSAPASAQAKRKPMRATQACEQCRQRKQKCDEGQPCSFCRDNNSECHYRDAVPAKTDKHTERMLADMAAIMAQLKDQGEELALQRQNIAELLSRDNKRESTADDKPPSDVKPALKPPTPDPKPATPADSQGSEKPEIWSEHRTGAHNLIMLWPSVRPLIDEMNKYDSSYVSAVEDKRGILRVSGKGQGGDEQDSSAPGPSSPAPSDDSHDSAPTPREGLWGRGFLGHATGEARNYGTEGGLLSDGSLDVNASTVHVLYESYMRTMHLMHPFLDKKRLKKMVESFINFYSPGDRKVMFANGTPNGVSGTETSESTRPVKRARVEAGDPGQMNTPIADTAGSRQPQQIEFSPTNAIVLLVLALGKICQRTAPLPAVPGDKVVIGQARNITSSGLHPTSSPLPIPPRSFSPRSLSSTNPTPPEHVINRLESRSPKQSFDTNSSSGKNIEIIPGLAYYAKAAEIMGGQADGSELMQAQMFLLAALYKGQLARVKDSANWLFLAGKVCYDLIDHYKLYWPKGNKALSINEVSQRMQNKHVQSILMAASTCLQLEADILAEMSYQPSPIQQIDSLMLPPVMMTDDDEYTTPEVSRDIGAEWQLDTKRHHYYMAQLYLRRRLNNAHKVLYGHALRNQSVEQVRESLLAQQSELEEWRKALPPPLQWQDNEPPATEILAARLRAKWYGASYVVRRPFLDYALHIMAQSRDGYAIEGLAKDAEGNPRDPADIMMFKSMQSMDEGTIWKAVRECVAAALQSTVALDGMTRKGKERLIVTNIHGTAHAQFGNMLVLAAAYNMEHLRKLVDTNALKTKLERTITFLRRLSPISPTSACDCAILEHIQKKLFPTDAMQIDPEPASATTSFSS